MGVGRFEGRGVEKGKGQRLKGKGEREKVSFFLLLFVPQSVCYR